MKKNSFSRFLFSWFPCCAVLYFLAIVSFSCKKITEVVDHSAKLTFSDDTVLFDTVFTTIGSTTKQLKVFNTSKHKVVISSIHLAGGYHSGFRLNVDGVPGKSFNNVEIAGNDSIYIFVEVTLNPNNKNTPILITDSILFYINNQVQDVDIVACGQDAYFHYPVHKTNFDTIGNYEIWNNDKPHVVYGYIFVDSANVLTINQGTKVYFHKNSGIYVYKEGTLVVNGTLDNEVVFQGDRLEEDYKDVPGQWDRIYLSPLSKNNKINYAIIKNGNIGIQVDTLNNNFTKPTLTLTNTIIMNMAGLALYAQGSFIKSYNCVFANCGQYLVALVFGGDYAFRNCTFANYWKYGNQTRKTPSLLLNNYYEDINKNTQVRSMNNAYFGNCIIYGNIENEIGLDYKSTGTFNYKFENCLLKTNENTSASNYISIINNPSDTAIFKSFSENNYELGDKSPAVDKGNVSITKTSPVIPLDLKGKARISGSVPDLGAYEKQ